MKLSELIAALQATLDEKGDTEHVALCFVVDGGHQPRRMDLWGDVMVQHDTAEYPNGVTYLVADQNLEEAR